MMKILSFITATLLFIGCSTLDVSVDYDDSYDFKSVKSFTVDNSIGTSKNTLIGTRIVNALEGELELKNYKKTSKEDANLIFVFYGSVKDKQSVSTSYSGYGGYGRRGGFGYGGMMMSTTNTYEYQEGTLVVDALNPKTKKIVWRGIGVKELKNYNTPKERTEATNAAVKKIMEKFPIH